MKIFLRSVPYGAAFAALLFYPLYQPILFDGFSTLMHTPLPLTCFALAAIANLVWVTLLVALLWTGVRATRLGYIVRLCVPAMCATAILTLVCVRLWHFASFFPFVICFDCFIVAMWLSYRFWPALYRRILKFARFGGSSLAMFCLFVILQLACISFWRPAPNEIERARAANTQPPSVKPRVIWILMDELSYDQVFGERAPGLGLPNFDAFRQDSTLFTNVQPVARFTELAVPSLLEGSPADRIHYTFGDHLLLASPGRPLAPFQPAKTPFAIAKREGMTTGVVGWYNPYCSMLSPFLDSCYWTETVFSLGSPVTVDAFQMFFAKPWKSAWSIFRPQRQKPEAMRQLDDYINLDRRARTMAGDNRFDFIFFHLPLPHPPGIYNRSTGKFDTSGRASYLDNLALADKTLGQLLAILRASPRWSDTSIVLCGDHSWRTSLWRTSDDWTPEDSVASHGGHFDPRPMLMVHRAGQTIPETINASFPLLKVHAILDDLIQGQQTVFR